VYILANYTAISLFVNRVGSLSNPRRYARVKQLVTDFESMPYSLGPEYTHFWLRDYERYLVGGGVVGIGGVVLWVVPDTGTIRHRRALGECRRGGRGQRHCTVSRVGARELPSLAGVPPLEGLPALRQEIKVVKGRLLLYRRQSQVFRLEKFFVTLAYHGEDLVKWRTRGDLLNEWRRKADK